MKRHVPRYVVPVFQSLGYSEVHKYEKDDSDVNVGDVIVKNDAESDIFYKVSLEAMIGKGEFTPTENDIAFWYGGLLEHDLTIYNQFENRGQKLGRLHAWMHHSNLQTSAKPVMTKL